MSNWEYKFYCGECSIGTKFYIRRDGSVYGFGYNSQNQIPIDPPTTTVDIFISNVSVHESNPIKLNSKILNNKSNKIRKICVSWGHSIFHMADYRVYGIGHNGAGQLGLGQKRNFSELTEMKVPRGRKIVDVCVGVLNTFFRINSTEIYGTGFNEDGQLGIGNEDNSETPKLMKFPKNVEIVDLKPGFHHTAALTKHGDVYVCGDPLRYVKKNVPTLLNFSEIFIKIIGGTQFFLLIGKSKSVYGVGVENRYDVVERKSVPKKSSYKSSKLLPIKYKYLSKLYQRNEVNEIVCSSSFYLVHLKDGSVIGRGDKERFGCFLKKEDSNGYVKVINDIEKVIIDRRSSFFFKKNGEIFCAGLGRYGELGNRNEEDSLDKIIQNTCIKNIDKTYNRKMFTQIQIKLFQMILRKLYCNVIISIL